MPEWYIEGDTNGVEEMASFFTELKRRNVFKVGVAYAIVSWLFIQIIVAIEAPLRLPEWMDTFIIILLIIGFPVALIFAWAFELTPEGIKSSKSVDRPSSHLAMYFHLRIWSINLTNLIDLYTQNNSLEASDVIPTRWPLRHYAEVPVIKYNPEKDMDYL